MTDVQKNVELDLNGDASNNIITQQDIIIACQRFTNDKSVKVLNYRFDDYSSDKLGFAGDHKSLKITLQRTNRNNSEDITFFVKSVPYNNKEQAKFLTKESMFIKESHFFYIISELMDNCDIERWFPLCYLAKEEFLIMEDLRLEGYKIHENLFDNTIALKSLLATLARFHGCSILTEARLNQHSNDQKKLNERYPDILVEKVFQQASYGSRWYFAGANLAAGVAGRLGYDPCKVHDAYTKLFDIVKPSDNDWNVICHGDLWGNNLMFADSSPLLKCILIDFQIIRYAPLVTDLLQVLHLYGGRAFRKKYEMDLVKFYHSILQQTVKRNDLTNTTKLPSVEEILKSMHDLRVFGLVMSTLYLPIVLLDQKIISERAKDSKSYHHFAFEDRLEVTLSYMKENKAYKNRIEEAIIELIESID